MKDDADLPCQLQSIRLDQLGLQGPLQQPTCSREDDERHHAKAGSQPGRYRWMAPGHRASVSSPRSQLEDVAHPSNRVEQLDRERLVELGAQTPYRDFHHVRVAVRKLHVPNEFGKHRARHDFTAMAQQDGQQRVLLRREVQSRAGAKRSSTYGVQFQISERHAVGFMVRTRSTAPQHGLDACQQLGKDEGFDQIVGRRPRADRAPGLPRCPPRSA